MALNLPTLVTACFQNVKKLVVLGHCQSGRFCVDDAKESAGNGRLIASSKVT